MVCMAHVHTAHSKARDLCMEASEVCMVEINYQNQNFVCRSSMLRVSRNHKDPYNDMNCASNARDKLMVFHLA